MSGGSWDEYAVVEQGWTTEDDGPPLWGWGTEETALMLLDSLRRHPREDRPDWRIVARTVTVTAPRPAETPELRR